MFEEVFIMTKGGPRNSSKTVVYYLYEQAFQNLEISYACTIGLVLFLTILLLSLLNLYVARAALPTICPLTCSWRLDRWQSRLNLK